jgi:asparagine synthase (glutamine-hydrolysing)
VCGIVSTIGYTEDDVEVMLQEIEHRGRDNREIYQSGNVILGHNRLSINDVSSDGNQPFVWNDYALVVNGEIWNYPQLRKEYEERGYRFFSNSDSEIILYLYKENELPRLDGMFSFALHDTMTNQLILSRDWVGKIPLYIYNNDTNIIVASEMKSKQNVSLYQKIRWLQ